MVITRMICYHIKMRQYQIFSCVQSFRFVRLYGYCDIGSIVKTENKFLYIFTITSIQTFFSGGKKCFFM